MYTAGTEPGALRAFIDGLLDRDVQPPRSR